MTNNIKSIIKDINQGQEKLGEQKFIELVDTLEKTIIASLKESMVEHADIDINDQLKNMLKDCISEDVEVKMMKENVSSIMNMYSNFKLVLAMKEKAISFLQECTQRFVVFSDYDFLEDFSKYEFADKEQMRKVCFSIRNAYYSHVAGRLAPSCAETQIKELFGFSEGLASTYRSLYELNYDKITMNVILSRLQE